MRKRLLILFLCVSVIGISACGIRSMDDGTGRENRIESRDGLQSSEDAENSVDAKNSTDMEKRTETETGSLEVSETESMSGQDVTEEEMLEKFHDKFYAGLSDEEIEKRVIERFSYCQSSSYNGPVTDYWENVRGVKDISCRIDPLFFTDMRYYSERDFRDVPPEVIHLAKNEIYARHGYIFNNEDLNNYFMGCAWYMPQYSSEEFSDSVFNDYEQSNLKLLKVLDQ